MKLTSPDRQPRRRGFKAAEALVKPEQPAEGLFDIRRFLQSNDVQYMKMKATVINPQPDDHEAFTSMTWLGRLDPEIDERLKASPGFKEFILEKFEKAHEESLDLEGDYERNDAFYIRLAGAYMWIFQGIQTFPELRQDPLVQEKLSQDYSNFLNIVGDTDVPLADRVPLATIFSMVMPEHRSELRASLLKPYDGQVENLLADIDLSGDEMQIIAFMGIILLPEVADQLKEKMRPQEPAMVEAWEAKSKKRKHLAEMDGFFGSALILTVLSAEKVTVSPNGQLIFELKSVPAAPPAPLPERPLA